MQTWQKICIVLVCAILVIGVMLLFSPFGRNVNSSPGSHAFTQSVRRLPASGETAAPPKPLVLVVGSGLAGYTVAIATRELSPNTDVVVVERQGTTGGNSIKAKSGVNRPGSDSEAERQAMVSDTVRAAQDDGPELVSRVTVLTADAAAAHAWVRSSLGVALDVVGQTGGHRVPRTYCTQGSEGVGQRLIAAASARARALGVRTVTGTTVEKISDGGGKWWEVWLANTDRSKPPSSSPATVCAVVFATGGFAHPMSEKLREVRPDLARLPTSNSPSSAYGGASLDTAAAAGAVLENLADVQVHPTGLVDPEAPDDTTKALVPEVVRQHAVLVDARGERFVSELETRDVVVDQMFRHGGHIFYLLASFVANDVFVQKMVDMKKARVASSPLDLASAMNISVPPQSATLVQPPFVLIRVTPVLHYTMGGIRVDNDGRVLDRQRRPITNLFAVGECTTGLHGRSRLAGNSLLECLVFGRRVAATLAASKLAAAPPQGDGNRTLLLARDDGRRGGNQTGATAEITQGQLASHKDAASGGVWIAIKGVVYDVTRYMDSHQGGKDIIAKYAGTDVTEAFVNSHKAPDLTLSNLPDTVTVVGRLVSSSSS